ncbi:MAG: alpha/beta fold hydrolase [Nitrosomonadales bacterium]|nr:alpha/beta fold hydrolase [Nitrosomonadales bacterium]
MEKTARTGVILRCSRRIRWALMLALLAYLAVSTYFWSIQRSKMYEPSAIMQTTPDRLGMKYEQLTIPSGSGAARGELHTWWIPAAQADAPTLLYLHGNKDNISHLIGHTQRLHDAGYNLLLPDYRGYGKSTGGEPDETRMYEDAEAAWNYLLQNHRQDLKRTFIYGHSLGGAIGIELALRHPEAAGLIVEGAFTSMRVMAEAEYSWLPVDTLLTQHFDSLSKVGRLKVPVLFIHGTWDKRIPYQMSQQLYEQAASPKTIKLIEGGEHNNSSTVGLLEYRAAFNEFTQRNSLR